MVLSMTPSPGSEKILSLTILPATELTLSTDNYQTDLHQKDFRQNREATLPFLVLHAFERRSKFFIRHHHLEEIYNHENKQEVTKFHVKVEKNVEVFTCILNKNNL